jgi:alpha-beta hydrolase superfamily lysophospholipase
MFASHSSSSGISASCSNCHKTWIGWSFARLRGDGLARCREEEYAPTQHGYDDGETFSNKSLTHSEIRWNLMRREYRENPAAKLGGPSVLWVKLAQEAGKTARENAADVKVPVLLLQAGDDTMVKPGGQFEFRDRLNQTHPAFCRPERIEGARHEIFMESDLYRQPAFKHTLDFIRNQTQMSIRIVV